MNVANDDVRELELELVRIRAEARAARLEARAAEIELMLRRSTRGLSAGVGNAAFGGAAFGGGQFTSENFGLESVAEGNKVAGDAVSGERVAGERVAGESFASAAVVDEGFGGGGLTGLRITSWEGLMQAAQHLIDSGSGEQQPLNQASDEQEVSADLAIADDGSQEVASTGVVEYREEQDVTEQVAAERVANEQEPAEPIAEPQWPVEKGEQGVIDVSLLQALIAEPGPKRVEGVAASEAIESLKQVEEEAAGNQREKAPAKRRPAAWIFSVLAHAAVLLVLAGITLSVPDPKDQMALSAAAVQPSEQQVETVELQQTEQPESESSESSETLASVDPVGEISEAVVDVTGPGMPDVVASPGESMGEMLSASVSAGATGNVSTTFFGASGGGNHFIYLVDSSGSMDNVSRDGFDVARAEVLRAVESLNEKQRFYVIFFGEETMRMRLSNPNEPEVRAVYATDANKRALRRWAMTIQMQPGKWPEEALEFAFTLRPDCIFLLTDGAMPDYVPDFVKRNNIVETLLDGPKPRSLIHTIGFHNAEGEAILSKIAKENGGKYHFVPANGGFRK